MPPIDPLNSLVKVAAAEEGPFATIADLTRYEWDHGSTDETRTRVFGKAEPYVEAGENDHTYSLSGLYNPDDTTGQNVLKTAKENGTDVWIQVLPDGADGWTEKGKVRRYSGDADADGDFVNVAFEFVGTGVTSAVVGA